MKKNLRNNIRNLKGKFSAEELASLSSAITTRVLADTDIVSSRTILLYSSLPDEVNTDALIDTFYSQGKTVLLPVVVGNDIELRQYSGSMIVGSYGILEPVGKLYLDYEHIDVALIPGIAFDRKGNRLGRGKGYYDRFLPKISSTIKIGLCFPFQIVESVPIETFDIPMDKVIS